MNTLKNASNWQLIVYVPEKNKKEIMWVREVEGYIYMYMYMNINIVIDTEREFFWSSIIVYKRAKNYVLKKR